MHISRSQPRATSAPNSHRAEAFPYVNPDEYGFPSGPSFGDERGMSGKKNREALNRWELMTGRPREQEPAVRRYWVELFQGSGSETRNVKQN